MATSSIVEKIRAKNYRVIEEFVAAMEASAKVPLGRKERPAAKKISDLTGLKKKRLTAHDGVHFAAILRT